MADIGTLIAYLEDGESERRMVDSICENLAFYQNIDTGEKVGGFAGSIYNWFIRECVGRNQYLVFPESAYASIFGRYKALVTELRKLSRTETTERTREEVARVVKEHRRALIAIVRPMDERTSAGEGVILPCAEYSESLQFEILRIDPDTIQEPFLDIGCGEKATLVKAIRARGKEAVGIDQYQPADDSGCVLRANWLEFPFVPDYWGTIVSHMAFSNHCIRAIKTDPELAAWYQAVYREILESLVPGGAFCYTPALPRAEAFIDRARFTVERMTNVEGSPELDTVRVTKR
mgnify:CR=1 FL=1